MSKPKNQKKANKNNKPKQMKLTQDEIEQIIQNIGNSDLDDKTKDLVVGLINLNGWLVEQIQAGRITIAKLRRLFACVSEPNKNRQERKDKANNKSSKDDNDKKGHGRNHSDEYTGAEVFNINHDTIKPGDTCPIESCEGKLYQSDPGIVINIEGAPIASAKKFIIEKLRCALCGELFVAPTPEDVNPNQKYSEGFVAMLMINKYFMATPLYRQETLQNLLGQPLPSSTQWDLLSKQDPLLEVIYEALMRDAANGKGFHLDDTSAKILEVIKESQTNDDVKGTAFTTGMISVHEDHRVAIFVTDEQTAGNTFAPIFLLRDKSLPEPYIMMDALSANIPNEIAEGLYTLCYCLVHARRNFYDLGDGYDDLVDVVLDYISLIYDNDKATKEMNDDDRLVYHQQHSQPIMDHLKDHLEKYKELFEPNSSPTKAINYMLKRWTELTQFLRFGDTPIDNNEMERGLKLVIRNRKNSMFYKTRRGATIAGYIQSLIYTAAQNGINPFEYLKWLLINKNEAIKNPRKCLPWNYQKNYKLLEPDKGCQDGSNLAS